MLAHRLRRWASIKPALGEHFFLLGLQSPEAVQLRVECCFNVGPPSTTLAQH